MVEIFFPRGFTFEDAVNWCRARGYHPGGFRKAITRPNVGYILVYELI